jgi:hypothetical protein
MLEENIFKIPLDEYQEYMPIEYLTNDLWSDDDKKLIEESIDKLFNLTNSGEQIVDTSLGSIKITYESHPTAKRKKLIQGFFVNHIPVLLSSTNTQGQINNSEEVNMVFDLLKIVSPNWLENNELASNYLKDLNNELLNLKFSDQSIKDSVFVLILDHIELFVQQSNGDSNSKIRIQKLIEIIKTFSKN